VEAGRKVSDLCCEHGFSEQTLYRWKARYGGMRAQDADLVRGLEEEVFDLRRRLRACAREQSAVRELLIDWLGSLDARRGAVRVLLELGASERRACELVGLARSSFRYRARGARGKATDRKTGNHADRASHASGSRGAAPPRMDG